ncbi:MAG: PLP-dependent lyase/thiolase [bacterium]
MISKNKKNIFRGEKAIFDYLTPGAMGSTPIIELPSRLNPFLKDKVHIYLKLAHNVPLTNIKSLSAWYMLNALSDSELKKIKNLVEYSSGNTVMSLAILSRHFGIPNMHAIITPDVPKNKQNLLKLLGVDLIVSDGPRSPDVHGKVGGIWDAMQMGKQSGWKNLNQYVNKNSPKASGEIIGKELWEQLGDKINILCVSLGTGGTVVGLGSYLRNKISDLCLIAMSIKSGSSIPGPRGEDAVKKLDFPWEEMTNLELPVAEKPAFEMSLKLIREGIFVGPSTGMQLAGILEVLKEVKKEKKLSRFHNKDKEINVVLVACDTMFPYIEDYFTVLSDELINK